MQPLLGILLIGLAATAVVYSPSFFRGAREQIDQLKAVSDLRRKGVLPSSDDELLTVPKSVLIDTLTKIQRRSALANWFQNFIWFFLGAILSLFSNEVRAFFGM